MVSLSLLLGCNLSCIVDLFTSLHELASASTRTLLKARIISARALKTLWRHLKRQGCDNLAHSIHHPVHRQTGCLWSPCSLVLLPYHEVVPLLWNSSPPIQKPFYINTQSLNEGVKSKHFFKKNLNDSALLFASYNFPESWNQQWKFSW